MQPTMCLLTQLLNVMGPVTKALLLKLVAVCEPCPTAITGLLGILGKGDVLGVHVTFCLVPCS